MSRRSSLVGYAMVREIVESERDTDDLTQLVLSEISDFFAGIGQPGAPETPEEMQAALMARVESVMRDHQ
ncbi:MULTISPECIES: hypothetical protein [Pectobacterium]|uniref:Uncharacterized protein n=1 Tax=Pectobacterium aquaticum TaxID=2204145 RepID=A0AA93DKI7_9GAMM|nr:hypothetical protein [Pectobacterium aquaticum]RRO12314.1 hypothetical protein DMB84_019390 [Pectobacterium aquaticum]